MAETAVATTAGEFLALVSKHHAGRIFRGQSLANWHLEPALDRNPIAEGWFERRLDSAAALLADFKRLARPHLQSVPSDDWEWLALAQHHGLLTPLLDWTTNPLVALFFAVDGQSRGVADSAVWCYDQANVIVPTDFPQVILSTNHIEKVEAVRPLSITDVAIYFPAHVSQRITAQSACFTVHPPPPQRGAYSWPGKVDSVLIPAASHNDIHSTLETCGVHRAALFPGLDGVASYLNTKQSYSRLDRLDVLSRVVSRLLSSSARRQMPNSGV